MQEAPNITPVAPSRLDGADDLAAWLRELADEVVAGEIVELVCIANSREQMCHKSTTHFRDRWRMLGAIEHMKHNVLEG